MYDKKKCEKKKMQRIVRQIFAAAAVINSFKCHSVQ